MTNEQIVTEIRNGYSITDNMQLLYERNLPLIKQIIKKYAAYEPMEDLSQESYFGLVEAVQHYESSKNVRFMTYAEYWVKQSVQRYLKKCGSIVRIPSHTRHRIARYKKTVHELEQELGRVPTNNEIADRMGISVGLLPELEIQMQGVASLDTPLTDDGSLTLTDMLQADFNLENDTVNKIYAEHSKNELWGIVAYYTSERENHIIREIFINNQTMAAVAREQGISFNRVRQIKDKALRKLRIGRAKHELLEKFDIVESEVYRNSMSKFNEHGFTSTVEYIALRRVEIQAEYEQRKKQIEDMFRQREKCL
ncbi:MAG: sigma-70 family RNA polymerase sigma factor [Bacteroidales bacterium]|nr:sigma-70 family RNA polymerase sigma factor [Lachnoclostridium sp.]MCM1384484.1 sigma-70 family RNA polymerase sigma factor [Lachnoclostridium sp.]MCM1464029.1 sigma-70 family RNA polymerase sigma factor [Bacteroidales bacterium]